MLGDHLYGSYKKCATDRDETGERAPVLVRSLQKR